jgi:transcriptional regulator with XRE-family HTH domain
MKINAALILEERLKRAWSQDELSIATGLSIRTIQRMEKEGLASLQSKKALAAVFDIDATDLDYEENIEMKRFEYKTVEMPFKFGLFKQKTPEVETLLNAEGEQGWRLHQIVLPASSNFGASDRMVVIFEREKMQ